MVKIGLEDNRRCELCGKEALVASYWEPKSQRAVELLVRPDCGYIFQRRDFRQRLVFDEKEEAMRASHNWVCGAMPAPPPTEEQNDSEDSWGKKKRR